MGGEGAPASLCVLPTVLKAAKGWMSSLAGLVYVLGRTGEVQPRAASASLQGPPCSQQPAAAHLTAQALAQAPHGEAAKHIKGLLFPSLGDAAGMGMTAPTAVKSAARLRACSWGIRGGCTAAVPSGATCPL